MTWNKKGTVSAVVSPALTIRLFSYYVLTLGVLLVVAPAWTLAVLQADIDDTEWIRALGIAVLTLGVYYLVASQNEATWFYRASIAVRIGMAVAFLILAFTAGPLQLLVIGAVELGGALWTRRALHKTERWA